VIVIKAGGSKGLDLQAVCDDIAALVGQKEPVVLVHGGSQETNDISQKLGRPPRFVTSASGHVSRYSDRETLEIFAMVVGGRINTLLVERLQRCGVNALGLTGLDGRLLEAQRKSTLRVIEKGKSLVLRGDFSGRIERVNVSLLELILQAGYVPVVAPLAISAQGDALNVDADRAAGAIGAALRADTVIILSNVPGLLRDFPDETSLIRTIPLHQAQEFMDRYAQGRMKKKILGAIEALQEGAKRVIIADGRVAQPVFRALQGHGTVLAAEP
jgi:acetylglutamate/LysW-gamma-L-alpha-aminoadipate kinase